MNGAQTTKVTTVGLRITLATEANEGLGHILPWLSFIQMASQAGHVVQVVSPQAKVVQELMKSDGVECRAGWWPSMHAGPVEQSSDSWEDLLWSLGYGSDIAVRACVKHWARIFDELKPDVVLADYAPIVMVVAKAMGIPVVEAGGGFCLPPRHAVGPAWLPHLLSRESSATPGGDLAQKRGQRITIAFNRATEAAGLRSNLREFRDIYRVALHRCVMSTADLDHYRGHRQSDVLHLGSLSQRSFGLAPSVVAARWMAKDDRSRRLLCYLKPATPRLDELLSELETDHGWNVLIVGLDENTAKRSLKQGAPPKPHLCFVSQPVDFVEALARADALLTNGGIHSLGNALLQGKECILVPAQAEQAALALQLAQQRMVQVATDAGSLRRAIARLNASAQMPHPAAAASPANAETAETKLIEILQQASVKARALSLRA